APVATTPLIVAAAAAAAWGLVILVDALNPPQLVKLSPALMALKQGGFGGGMGIAPRVIWGIVALVAIGLLLGDPLTKLGCVAGIAVIIGGGALLNNRDHRGAWVLERHPEWVVWVYA